MSEKPPNYEERFISDLEKVLPKPPGDLTMWQLKPEVVAKKKKSNYNDVFSTHIIEDVNDVNLTLSMFDINLELIENFTMTKNISRFTDYSGWGSESVRWHDAATGVWQSSSLFSTTGISHADREWKSLLEEYTDKAAKWINRYWQLNIKPELKVKLLR